MTELDFSYLNEEQINAVEQTEGPLLVLAGAGSGKTTVLTYRLANIINKKLAAPFHCLAVTFTNKAANEMRERLLSIIGPSAESIWLGTFHKLAAKIVRKYAELIGLNSNFNIMDTSDQEKVLKKILQKNNIDVKKFPTSFVLERIQKQKDEGFSYKNCQFDDNFPYMDTVYPQYQQELLSLNSADFGDLLLHCLTLFQEHIEILNEYRQKFKYILVDEFQDTNPAQHRWLQFLASEHHNICCVGDDDQSIYSWRGSEIKNILDFEKNYQNASIIKLESNYRSTQHILGAASSLISNNTGRLDKTIHTAPERENNIGDLVQVSMYFSDKEEAENIAYLINQKNLQNVPFSKMAILIRTSSLSRTLTDTLSKVGIPFMLISNFALSKREEIKDAISYIQMLIQPMYTLSFERILEKTISGIGKVAIKKILTTAEETSFSCFDAIKILDEGGKFKGKSALEIKNFITNYELCKNFINNEKNCAKILEFILQQFKYYDFIENKEKKIEHLNELKSLLVDYTSIEDCLEDIMLKMNGKEDFSSNCVKIMTLHAAKGLEFECVFLPGWEEGLFPHQRSLDEGGEEALEEERRLAYVGITRAEKNVYISSTAKRFLNGQIIYNQPSRFLYDLSNEHVKITGIQTSFTRNQHENYIYDTPFF